MNNTTHMTMPTNQSTDPSYSKSNPSTFLNICSLNARSLIKSQTPGASSTYIRFLRSLKYDLLCFQETHSRDTDSRRSLDMLF
jgi:hypothetical protein